ncbi:kelch-like protein 20 [Hydractinia symbiolongicarpus]|uniref:kelch-like protein 20 n=1 Tax=Hydractinia symbiolongicarpus TaxID=13093 RepID=UPI00254F0D98|nr:kelch-like protein 20 [Hydractinia symbiolongicarpus]
MLTMRSDSELPECETYNEAHSAKILYLMNQHRKENTKLCDVVLQVNKKKYPTHRSVLAACSPYFLAMFNGDMKESAEKTIVLKDVKEDIIELIIDFVYTGNLNVNIENVESILEHATLLQFSEVRLLACNFLEQQLDPENCVGIRKFVHLHHCKKFICTVDNFMKKHFLQVLNSDEFTSIPFSVLKEILLSEKLNVDCEERVYNCVLKWIKHDPIKREPKLSELLAATRLSLLEKQFLMDVVDQMPLIKNDPKCRDLLDEAKNYHLQPEKHAKLRSLRTIPRHSTCGRLYAIGGKKDVSTILNKVEAYSLFNDKWSEVANLRKNRQQLSVCTLNKKLYAIAGSDGVNRLDSVEVYSPTKNKWKECSSLQTCRSGAVGSALRDAIFVAGGYDGRSCLNSVERFDPVVQRWDFVASMNVARSFPTISTLGNCLYTIGGNDGAAFLDTCECFDPLMNKWRYIAPMKFPRAGLGCAVLNGMLYVAGGFDGVDCLNLVEMYEPRMNKWTEVSPMNQKRDGLSLISYGGYIYAIGGIDDSCFLNTAEYYDPTTNVWTETVPMILPRASAGSAVLIDGVNI